MHDQSVTLEIWDTDRCLERANDLAALLDEVLPGDDWADFGTKLAGRRHLMAVVALDRTDQLVGTKIGYERNRGVLNSCLGGVRDSYRGQGLAQKLAMRQHDWAKEAGFRGVETATRQHNAAMGIVNLKSGFVVSGIDVVPGEPTKIIFYKALQETA